MPHLPAIRPLVWEKMHDDGAISYARSVVGMFMVYNGAWKLNTHYVHCRDDDTAKAAAQAHYEALIRSTLE